MKKNIIAATFTRKVRTHSTLDIHPQSAGQDNPGSGFQPPKNSVANRADATATCPYSPTKNNPNLKLPYSVWKPLTRSVSLSAISNGSLFVSANRATKNKNAVRGCVMQSHMALLWLSAMENRLKGLPVIGATHIATVSAQMPIVSSYYWNQLHGNTPEEALQDEEGLATMQQLGLNMAWLMQCVADGAAAGHTHPGRVHSAHTNFVR